MEQENTPKYYRLKKGEIIQEGDEVEVSAKWNDPPKWVPANPGHYGSPAPDPNYMAHRQYRGLISVEKARIRKKFEQMESEGKFYNK